jgi:hypothetical protein
LIPIVASALIVSASFFSAPILTDSLNGKAAADATLRLSLGYKLLAPICDTLDTISLFSQRQHLAFLITCLLVYISWRILRVHRRGIGSVRLRPELAAFSKALMALIGVYVIGAMLPRPIASISMSSPDAIVIDFHSHTRYSWDGVSGFSPEESRRWHQASGFNVAYITDHSTFAGAEEAALSNPAHAGDGTVLLSGIEVRDRGNHLVVLGTGAGDWQSYTAGDLHELTFRRETSARGSARPIVLFTLPGTLQSESAMSVDGIELSDAAPRGLSQSDAEHAEIVALAREQNKPVLASSNNHGWASASPAWSVMDIHNWRTMTPSQLDTSIRRALLNGGFASVRVIDRRAPAPVSIAGVAMTVPDAALALLAHMSWAERFSWLGWLWFSYVLVLFARRFRSSERRVEEIRELRRAS